METMRHEIWIKADVITVFDAITTREGLDRWWGKAVSAEPKVGHVVEFDHGFGPFRFRVTELVPNHRVAWKCISDLADPENPASEWLGHELRFDLSSAADEPLSGWLSERLAGKRSVTGITILRFTDPGWSRDDRWYAFCNGAWGRP